MIRCWQKKILAHPHVFNGFLISSLDSFALKQGHDIQYQPLDPKKPWKNDVFFFQPPIYGWNNP